MEAWIEICFKKAESEWIIVASFMEARIEIEKYDTLRIASSVASFLEAWIEIKTKIAQMETINVASFMEARIEMPMLMGGLLYATRRLLHGGVD